MQAYILKVKFYMINSFRFLWSGLNQNIRLFMESILKMSISNFASFCWDSIVLFNRHNADYKVTHVSHEIFLAWWQHRMGTFSALLAFCAGNSPVTGEFHTQRPVICNFDVFFDMSLNQQMSKQWRRRRFETSLRWLWRHCNGSLWFCITLDHSVIRWRL